jgi:hypothetical protein
MTLLGTKYLTAVGALIAIGSIGTAFAGAALQSETTMWCGVGGMAVAAVVTGIGSWASGKSPASFGTESFPIANVTDLRPVSGGGEAVFGTEADPITPEAEHTLERTEIGPNSQLNAV